MCYKCTEEQSFKVDRERGENTMHPVPRSAPVCQTNFIKVCVLLFLIALHVFALLRH